MKIQPRPARLPVEISPVPWVIAQIGPESRHMVPGRSIILVWSPWREERMESKEPVSDDLVVGATLMLNTKNTKASRTPRHLGEVEAFLDKLVAHSADTLLVAGGRLAVALLLLVSVFGDYRHPAPAHYRADTACLSPLVLE